MGPLFAREKAGCAAAAADPALLATDLADDLVRRGVPFRQAHQAVGAIVALAEKLDRPLNELSLAELRSVEPKLRADVSRLFDLRQAMARRNLTGAPGTKEDAKQLARWKLILSR